MADTYYAWSKIDTKRNEWGQALTTLMPGEEVSQDQLGVNDDEWKSLLDSGAVRKDPYPEIANTTSPAEHYAANPEEAPQPDVDVTTPSEEAMPKTENPPGTTQPPTGSTPPPQDNQPPPQGNANTTPPQGQQGNKGT